MKYLLFIIEVILLITLLDKITTFNALFIIYYGLVYATIKNGCSILKN